MHLAGEPVDAFSGVIGNVEDHGGEPAFCVRLLDERRERIQQRFQSGTNLSGGNFRRRTPRSFFPALLAGPRMIQSLAVFTGSASGKLPVYEQAAEDFARTVAGAGRAIVYGGGRVGLMGTIADAARSTSGKVFGVMPQVLVEGELAHPGLTSLEVVPDMHARKHRMSELADGFVALPGGAGTLEELFEVWTWQQLGIHAKPVALLDVDGFWQPLLKMLDHMTDQGFLAPQFRDSLVVASEPEALLDALSLWQAPAAKWGAGSKN